MTEMRDGGPAFPVRRGSTFTGIDGEKRSGIVEDFDPGMSMRDWFAGQAMSRFAEADGDAVELGKEEVAQECYAFADAMLAARAPAQAPPAPAQANDDERGVILHPGGIVLPYLRDEDRDLICYARTDIPALLARVRELEAREAEARRLLIGAEPNIERLGNFGMEPWRTARAAYLSAKGTNDGE